MVSTCTSMFAAALRIIAPLKQSVGDEITEGTFGFPKKTVNWHDCERGITFLESQISSRRLRGYTGFDRSADLRFLDELLCFDRIPVGIEIFATLMT